MPVILCHNSALEYYRNSSDDLPIGSNIDDTFAPLSSAQTNRALDIAPSTSDIELFCNTQQDRLSSPLHILVKNRQTRPYKAPVICHSSPSNAPFGLIRSAQKIFGSQRPLVSSGPFTLCQLANDVTKAELALLCFELCGNYRLTTQLQDVSLAGFCKSAPITSAKAISAFTCAHPSMRGSKRLATVAKFIAEGSASPRESQLAIVLCFPTKWGGYNLPMPLLNSTIEIDTNAKLTSRKNFFSCDMLWPKEKLVIEYDSNQFHTGAQRISNDALRRNILQDMGYTVITVTNDQLTDSNKTHNLARQISKQLGIRFRGKKSEPNMARFELRNELRL